MSGPIGIAILGSTGSIGVSTLNVLQRHPERFRVVALTAHRDVEGLFQQCLTHEPEYAVMADADAAEQLRDRLQTTGRRVEVLAGVEGLERVAALPGVGAVMAAIVGAVGLLPTLAAARAGKRVLLANKEALVMAGPLFMAAVRERGAELLPIDSEHNAVFQCLPPTFATEGLDAVGVRRILLTGSGGPFRLTPLEQLPKATPEQACAHPNWSMGRKISVDSATMMNKGLEVIEAHWLFGAPPERIEVVVHPQSVIHSMVEYRDGSVLAQLGNPDMRTPIAHALAWPRRLASGATFLDFAQMAPLEFTTPDFSRFPCLELAFAALAAGGTAPVILNAADEIAVQAFLDRRIRYTDIHTVVQYTLERVNRRAIASLAVILDDDVQARTVAGEWVAAHGRGLS
ncbi:MAG: 1-deoxy-D-xylulose-5-phosphate reductoisomerase [Candidatus Competibacteraceae bacterium]|nr:1-deoxy-D-xylulose-5-phosphate reductoisomerase [Candidatus Competibacteraceae bacterium]MCP5124717.1 1-deoxy-D-xylulose-5-phosphate reductoisomerase [Gammaproteobacteria bacterium]HRX70830.1 1-deoxy-D-xylulose-5-phosphate reductoisomerase [Candidatus Competibacteraceae bacterium]